MASKLSSQVLHVGDSFTLKLDFNSSPLVSKGHHQSNDSPPLSETHRLPQFLSADEQFGIKFSSKKPKSKLRISDYSDCLSFYLNSIFEIRKIDIDNDLDDKSPVLLSTNFHLFLKSSGYYLHSSQSNNIISIGVDLFVWLVD